MFCATKGVERSWGRTQARSRIYNICETLFLYYNVLISTLLLQFFRAYRIHGLLRSERTKKKYCRLARSFFVLQQFGL